MKRRIATFIATVVVAAGIGTAIASVPSGTSTSFNVQDPAVTVIASGQTSDSPGENCSWTASSTVYCYSSALAFTPTVAGVCQVNIDDALYGNPMGKEAGKLNNVGYGVGVRIEGTDTKAPDETGITTTPTYLSEQSVSRSRLVPVVAGKSYTFEPWIESYGTSEGTNYWNLTYVCFGA